MGLLCEVRALTQEEADAFWRTRVKANLPTGINLGKSWHALHWLLTKSDFETPHPLAFLVRGGRETEGEYPYRFFDATLVCSLLDQLPDEALLRERFDPRAMDAANVYPVVWTREGAEARDWVFDCYRKLRDYFVLASLEGKGLLVLIS